MSVFSQTGPYTGYLYAKLSAIGSKFEGPVYYLQQLKGGDLVVAKKCLPWENDPVLHQILGTKIIVRGTLTNEGITYDTVEPMEKESHSTRPSIFEGRKPGTGVDVDNAIKDAIAKAPQPGGNDMLQKFRVVELGIERGGIIGKTTTIARIELLTP